MMFKSLFFILISFQSLQGFASVELRWLTVASVAISDGTSTLLFDPSFTRPTIGHWLNFKKLRSDPGLVSSVLKENDLTKVDAVFASHSHFDHVVDAPLVAKIGGAVFYADESQKRIVDAYKDPEIKTSPITPGAVIEVGKFKIIILKRTHAGIFHMFDYLPGSVPSDFDFNFYDYHVGDTWCYVIHHPEGTILIDQGADPYLDLIKPYAFTVDVLIQGVANRKNNESIVDGYLNVYKPKIFIPVHFDNFLGSFDPKTESSLVGVRLDGLLEDIHGKYKETKVIKPRYGEMITLFEKKLE